MNFADKENVDIMDFQGVKRNPFQRKKLVERSFCSISETCMMF